MVNLSRQLLAAFAMCLLWLLCFGCASNHIPDTKQMVWDASEGATGYHVWLNDKPILTTTDTTAIVPWTHGNSAFVTAFDGAQESKPSNTITN